MEAVNQLLSKCVGLFWILFALLALASVVVSRSPGGLLVWLFGFSLIVTLAPSNQESQIYPTIAP